MTGARALWAAAKDGTVVKKYDTTNIDKDLPDTDGFEIVEFNTREELETATCDYSILTQKEKQMLAVLD